jgi:hypothetical protein
MAHPFLERTARESPTLATMRRLPLSSKNAVVAVDPALYAICVSPLSNILHQRTSHLISFNSYTNIKKRGIHLAGSYTQMDIEM